MLVELLDFFLGAVHVFVIDPDLLPCVDASLCIIICTLLLGTACSMLIWSLRLIWSAFFGGGAKNG